MAKPRSLAPLDGRGRTARSAPSRTGNERLREEGGLAPRRTDSCAASLGLVCDGSQGSRGRLAVFLLYHPRYASPGHSSGRKGGRSVKLSPKSAGWLSSLALSKAKRKKQQQILTARTPCRPAARRRSDLKPPARRGARLDRVYGKCTAAAARTTAKAPHLLRQRPAARRRRRRGGLRQKHTPSRHHKYVEMRPAKRARAQTRT